MNFYTHLLVEQQIDFSGKKSTIKNNRTLRIKNKEIGRVTKANLLNFSDFSIPL